MEEKEEALAISHSSSKSGRKQVTKVETSNLSLGATQLKSAREREDSMNHKISVFTKLNNGPNPHKSSNDKKTISNHSSKKRSLNQNSSKSSRVSQQEIKKLPSTVKNSSSHQEVEKEEEPKVMPASLDRLMDNLQ